MFNTYNRIDTKEKLKELDDYLTLYNPKFIAFDTETNGLNIYKTTLVGFSISINRSQGFYIPFLDWTPDVKSLKSRKVDKIQYESFMEGHLKCVWTGKSYPEFVKPDEYRPPQFIIDYMAKWLLNKKLYMHNAPFDVNMTYVNLGLDLKDSLYLDTSLLSHIINENSPNSLKKVGEEWRNELGLDPYKSANIEQQELIKSILINGGSKGEVWRASPEYQSKYAAKDTMLTYGLAEVGLKKFVEDLGEEKLKWLFEDEVMPLCREVVIPMKRRGVYIDSRYFEQMAKETKEKLDELEDKIVKTIESYGFPITIGKNVDEVVSKQRILKKIIELEGLSIPLVLDKKTNNYKESLASAIIKKEYQKTPHWVWGYILGEDELKYSEPKLDSIKKALYLDIQNCRHRFNIKSDYHLRWLFCDKLGMDKRELPQTDSATKDNPIPSVNAEVLTEHMLPKFEWVSDLLLFKKLQKLYSTYIMAAVELNLDGWLYMDMRQNGTTSGRFSCSGGFNLQTLPRSSEDLSKCGKCGSKNIKINQEIDLLAHITCEDCGHFEENILCNSAIKKGFIAPPGYKIVNADFSSLEPRSYAFVSGDSKLKDIYIKGLDFYCKVYCDMLDKRKEYSPDPKDDNFLKKVNPELRSFVKPLPLGIVYGSGDYEVARAMGLLDENGRPDSKQGKQIRDQFLNTYKDLAKYMKKCEIGCIEHGFVSTLVGRKRHFELAKYVNKNILSKDIRGNDKHSVEIRYHRFNSFISTSNKYLQKSDTYIKVGKGYNDKILITKDDLQKFSKHFKIDIKKIYEKGIWGYIKALVKNEFNNAKNFPIQGLAGHIANKGMLDAQRYFNQVGLDSWICLQVHDEITVYAKENICEEAATLLQIGMEDNQYTRMLDIPMIAEPMIGNNLKETK